MGAINVADILTMQDLANGHLDVKALGEAANGDENTIVTTRTGNTYPSAERAINIMFKNGGLPATPFATKALMTASALANDKYAMVTDDTANNGLYVKTAGAWVKSAYDPVTTAKTYTDLKTSESVSGFDTVALRNASNLENNAYAFVGKDPISKNNGYYKKEDGAWKAVSLLSTTQNNPFIAKTEYTLVDLQTKATGYYKADGVYVQNPLITTSMPIAVKKGECYVLSGLTYDPVIASLITMVTESGGFITSLSNSTPAEIGDVNFPILNSTLGRVNNSESSKNIAVVIPNDGFISVSSWTAPTNPSAVPKLYRTDFEGFLGASQIQAPRNILSFFKDIMYSAKIDKTFIAENKNTIVGWSPLGEVIAYGSSIISIISEKYPIKEGEFIHVHGVPADHATYRITIEDANGVLLATPDMVTEYTLGARNAGYVGLNIKATATGFFRVSTTRNHSVPLLVGSTKTKVNFSVNYLKDNQTISFYNNVSTRDITNGFGVSHTSISPRTLQGDYNNLNSRFTISEPCVLRKGDVLEYELSSTVFPVLVVAYERGNTDNISPNDHMGIALNAVEIVSYQQKLDWISAGKPTGTTRFSNGSRGKVAYCNDESDSVIIFLRPSEKSSMYDTYKQSTEYKLSIMTKADYIVKRNAELVDRFTIISGMDANPIRGEFSIDNGKKGAGSFPSVLMFKGEVLSYLTNHYGSGVTQKLGYTHNMGNPPNIEPGAKLTYLQIDYNNFATPPITKNNKQSYRYAQVYCTETSVFTPSVVTRAGDNVTPLDIEGLIANKYYPARIMQLKDVKVGENIEPTFYEGFYAALVPEGGNNPVNPEGTEVENLAKIFNMANDTLISFAPKGSYIEADNWYRLSYYLPFLAPLKKGYFEQLKFTSYAHKGDSKLNKYATMQLANYRYGFELKEDSVVVVPSQTAARAIGDVGGAIDVNNPIMVGTYEHNLKTINSAEAQKYKVTSDTRIRIPNTDGLTFNFCTGNSVTLKDPIWGIMQILQNSKVIVTLNVQTENQGQSTADSARKNVNVECFNDKFQKVSIQFGDNLEVDEFVLKSYLNSDKGHYRDTLSGDTWHSLRTADNYPSGTVIPKEVFDDLNYPKNQKARGTPFGFPVELHRGSKFNSLATLRIKKPRENYGVQKGNKNHILMEADWMIKGVIRWATVDLGNFEIRNPSMKPYNGGETTLPAGFESVEAASKRIINWMRDGYTKAIDLRSTYSDYIDLDSFLDYSLAIAVTGNQDGVYNNFLLGTHDGAIWRPYWYDADGGWGGTTGDVKTPIEWMDSSNFFKVLSTAMLPELKARYAKHRQSGVLSIKTLQTRMKNISDSMHSDSKELDVKYWGAVPESAGLPSGLAWCKERIEYLDTVYGYVD